MLVVSRYLWFTTAFSLWIFVLSADNSSSENEGPKCKTIFTFGYGYRQFFHMSQSSLHPASGDLLFMKFSVKARSDAHILLSPSPSPEDLEPVYEIVLGAGKNTFSDIRRRRRAATKTSAYTKDILSGTEQREFWVRMNHQGMISVGHEGEDLPFMEWQDPDPLLILYFSFCTWSGVAGKWIYDCSSDNDSGAIEVQPVLTAVDKLRQALLTNYDVYSRPVSNASQQIQIYIQIQANHVQLDAKQSVMTVGCMFTLEWYDEKMVWSPDNFDGLNILNLVHHEIWIPELVNFNAVGKGVSPLGPAAVRVTSNGKVRWSTRSHLQTRCQLDLRQWPWDTQTCSIQLGFWTQTDTLQLILFENGTKLELQKTSSEWEVQRLDAETIAVRRPWLPDLSSDDGTDDITPTSLTFTFVLKRASFGYIYVLIIPILVMIVMSLACFWMDVLGKEKLATNCLLLLLLSGFLLSLESNLPAPADHAPFLFRVYSLVLAVVTCATTVTVIVTNLTNTCHVRPPPRFLCDAISSPFIGSVFCLPKPKLREPEYNQMRERGVEDSLSMEPECDSVANLLWAKLAVFCDRVAFFFALFAYTAIFVF
ncbi:hypothetical protein J6590_023296 [Homalodisca vitripennis]|nr:hypothetical protein J6590_023296 [Homalodisca vitripennis]